jgi:hypothetical protein
MRKKEKDPLKAVLPELGKEMLRDFEEEHSFKALTTYSAILNRLLEISLMGPAAVQQAVEAIEEFLRNRRVEVKPLGGWIESWEETFENLEKMLMLWQAADRLADRLQEIIDRHLEDKEEEKERR